MCSQKYCWKYFHLPFKLKRAQQFSKKKLPVTKSQLHTWIWCILVSIPNPSLFPSQPSQHIPSLQVPYGFLFYTMTHGVWPGLSVWTQVHWSWVNSPMGIRLKEMTAVPQNPPVANSWTGMGRALWAPPWSMIDCQPQLLWGHDWWLWHAWNVAYRSLASILSASCSTMLPEP